MKYALIIKINLFLESKIKCDDDGEIKLIEKYCIIFQRMFKIAEQR